MIYYGRFNLCNHVNTLQRKLGCAFDGFYFLFAPVRCSGSTDSWNKRCNSHSLTQSFRLFDYEGSLHSWVSIKMKIKCQETVMWWWWGDETDNRQMFVLMSNISPLNLWDLYHFLRFFTLTHISQWTIPTSFLILL